MSFLKISDDLAISYNSIHNIYMDKNGIRISCDIGVGKVIFYTIKIKHHKDIPCDGLVNEVFHSILNEEKDISRHAEDYKMEIFG